MPRIDAEGHVAAKHLSIITAKTSAMPKIHPRGDPYLPEHNPLYRANQPNRPQRNPNSGDGHHHIDCSTPFTLSYPTPHARVTDTQTQRPSASMGFAAQHDQETVRRRS